MPVSLNQFSNIAARQNVRDSGVVRVDSREDLRLNQSRFRLVRWVRDSGIGKRLSNRNTVNAFISSLENHYDSQVISRMDLRPLRDLQSRGKPLHVRDIRAAMHEADMVADGVKQVKSSIIEGLVNDQLAGATYMVLPGGEDLAREVRNQVDIAATQLNLDQALPQWAAYNKLSEGGSLSSAKGWAETGVSNAQKDIFLTGYGIKTASGQQFDKLQRIFDRYPQAQALKARYGPGFDASRASGALYRVLSETLSPKLTSVMDDPEQLPGKDPSRSGSNR